MTLFALAIPGREMGDCHNPSSTSMCFIFIMCSSGILLSTEVTLINQAADLWKFSCWINAILLLGTDFKELNWKQRWTRDFCEPCYFIYRSVIKKSPLVHLLISEECDVPWLFLVDLVVLAAKDSDTLKQVNFVNKTFSLLINLFYLSPVDFKATVITLIFSDKSLPGLCFPFFHFCGW